MIYKYVKILFYWISINIFLILPSVVAMDEANIKELDPHISVYPRRNLQQDLQNPSKFLEAIKFLYKEVKNDKDFLAAVFLKKIRTIHPDVDSYVKGENKSDHYIEKAIKIGKKIKKEESQIIIDVDRTLRVMKEEGNIQKFQKAALWLEKPLPADRIKLCIRTLLLLGFKNDPTVEKIIAILSNTEFGAEQVKAAKEKLLK